MQVCSPESHSNALRNFLVELTIAWPPSEENERTLRYRNFARPRAERKHISVFSTFSGCFPGDRAGKAHLGTSLKIKEMKEFELLGSAERGLFRANGCCEIF